MAFSVFTKRDMIDEMEILEKRLTLSLPDRVDRSAVECFHPDEQIS